MKRLVLIIAILAVAIAAQAQNLEFCQKGTSGGYAVKTKDISYTAKTMLANESMAAAHRFSFFVSDTPTYRGGLFMLTILHPGDWYVKKGEVVAIMFNDGTKHNTVTGEALSEPYAGFYRTILKLPLQPGELIKFTHLDAFATTTSNGEVLTVILDEKAREKIASAYLEAYDGLVAIGWSGLAL